MCRHVGYIGPDVRVDRVVLGPPHSLLVQSYQARELLDGSVAADGFGVAWYRDEAGDTPAAYHSLLPIWADRSFESVASHVFGHTIMGNVRNATEAGTTDVSNVHPFTEGRYAFSHNGYVSDFRVGMMRALRTELSDEQYARLRGTTDAETIFRHVLTRIGDGRTLRAALVETTERILALADEQGLAAQMNLMLTDGVTMLATRAGNQPQSNSLYTAFGHPRFEGAVLVASEPLDEGPWQKVPDRHLVVLHAGERPELIALG